MNPAPAPAPDALVFDHVTKRYGEVAAVDDVLHGPDVRPVAVCVRRPHARAVRPGDVSGIPASERQERERRAAIEALESHGIEPVHLECGRREDLSPLIVKNAQDVDCAVVGGGDGTLNAAAFGVIEAGLPLTGVDCMPSVLVVGRAHVIAKSTATE